MKRTILFILLCAVTFVFGQNKQLFEGTKFAGILTASTMSAIEFKANTAQFSYTAIPDANFEAALVALGIDTVANDGQVLTADIQGITTLNLNNQSISDLTGIEDFVALTYLNVDTNNLTALDISNNTNLQTLIVNNNSLTELEVINNIALTNIQASNNQLSTLEVDTNVLLTSLTLSLNPLANIDVSNNMLLEQLNVSDTGLTSLEITNNLNLGYVYAQDNALTSLDISQNSLLQILNVQNNNLTAINTSNNPLLTQLLVDFNQLTSLDVSSNIALARIECSNNNLSTLNVKNGNNTAIPTAVFNASGNPLLTCIAVDDATYSNATWTNIDSGMFFSSYDCRFTAIPDANFEAALDTLGYDDITGDGQVPTALIEVVTSLDVSIEGIDSMTGIEDFTALETLNCSVNPFETLDISSNTQLKTLISSGGRLNAIDVTNNPLLEVLDISENDDIAILDLTNNTILKELTCNNNSLTNLDVSTNTALEILIVNENNLASLDLTLNTSLVQLDARNNSLASLDIQNGNNTNVTLFDVRSNSNLFCINVDDVAYSTTNWTNISSGMVFSDDGCRYTQIPDATFEAELEALGYDDVSGDGQVPTGLIEVVTSLNLDNKGINDATGIEDFTALTNLNLRRNNLTTINVSQNVLLESLNVAQNNLNAIDITSNTLLDTVNLFNNNLTTLDISNNTALEIVNLESNAGLTSLDTSNNLVLKQLRIFSTDIAALDISTNTELKILYAYDIPLGTIDVSTNPALEQLRVNNTNVTVLDVSNNTNLVSLRVNDTGIQTLDLSNQSALTVLFAHDTSLSFLNVQNGNNINVGTFRAENNPNLSCILVDVPAFSTTNWTDVDAGVTFSDTFCRYTTIPDTNFEAALNTLGYDDIANDGQVPTTLIEVVTTLDVSNQNIGDLTGIEDFTALVDLNVDTNALISLDVSNNTNLETLVFNTNQLTSLNLGTNTNLDHLEGKFNLLTSIDVSNTPNITFLNLRDNLLTSVDISQNTLVETINFRECANLASLDISANVNAITVNLQDTPLSTLDVSYNPLIETLIIERTNINSLDVSNLSVLSQLRIGENNFTALDVSNNPALVRLECEDNNLTYLNVKNGNNTNIPNADFIATGNPNLTCILVDDVTWSTTNWTNIDPTTSFSNTYCRYTAIPDAVFEARLETLGYDDISGDGQVPTALIEGVTDLFVTSLSLNDITGIEDFIALENFTCSGTSVSSMDLSNNTQLRTASLANNNINSFNISNAPALEELNLRGNNLTTIDVTNNTALLELNLSGNNISTINLSNNTVLKELELSGNDLTTLDISTNTALTNLNIEGLNITALDVSTNTLLEEFIFSYTALISLDLSNNVSLTYLECIESNQLTALDLSTLALLEDLYLTDNALLSELNVKNGNNTEISTFEVIGAPNLTCILVDDATYSTANWTDVDATVTFRDGDYCRYTAIPDAIFEAELEALGYDDISGDGQVPTALIEVVTSLGLNNLNINDLTGIEDFAALETLNARGNNLTAIDVSQNSLLRSLYINSNSLSTIDLSNNAALRNLNIGSNGISTLDLSNNLELRNLYVQLNTGLLSLDLSNNLELRELYAYSSNLTQLDLSVNTELRLLSIYRSAITSIDLTNNVNLTALRVDETNFTALDLTNNLNIETLRINDTNIESLDLSDKTAFRSLLAHDTSLNYLNVQNGNNTNVGTFRLENNPNLTCVLVDDVAYSTANWTDIDTGLIFSDTYCRYTAIPDANFEARLEALGYDDISSDGQVPTALIEVVTTLDINSQGIADITGIEDFIALTNFDVSNNMIGSLDMSNSPNLASLEANECGLTSLDISQNTALFSLSAHSNQLTSLNTTNNTGLESITLYGNLLTAVDFTTNTALDYVDVFQNQLTALDLRTNTDVEVLFCDDNNITDLDLSLNSKLETISCSGNELISLNIQNGNNTAITSFDALNNDDLYCILVDDEAYSNTNWTNKDAQANYNETSCDFVIVDVDVFLQGALINPNTGEETLMRDDLRANGGSYGTTSPYGDGAMISENVGLNITGNNATVDWIWVELRDADSPTTIIAGQSGILQRDGDIVDTSDDANPLTFENVPAGDYFIVVKHRNHLGIMSASAISLKQVSSTIDFTDATNEITYGSNAQTAFGMPTDVIAMWAGNVNGDTVVQYSGVSPDTPDILSKVLNDAGNFLNFPTYIVSGYNPDDVNLDGNTQYSGTNPDTPFILQNVLAHPGNFLNFSTYQIIEQLPDNE
ncbi:MAG: hypothetical protein AAF611_06665 [Bacteroidota bacterium]